MENFPVQVLHSGISSIFWLFIIAYLLLSAVLVYHWQKYGGKSRTIFIAETVFIVGSLILLLIAFFMIPR